MRTTRSASFGSIFTNAFITVLVGNVCATAAGTSAMNVRARSTPAMLPILFRANASASIRIDLLRAGNRNATELQILLLLVVVRGPATCQRQDGHRPRHL